jgi:hypothetical protein
MIPPPGVDAPSARTAGLSRDRRAPSRSQSLREGRRSDMAVGVSVGYMSVGWACGRARGRGALGERPNGEGVEWEVRGVERADMEIGEGVGWGALGF